MSAKAEPAECDFIYFAFLLSFRAAQNHFDH